MANFSTNQVKQFYVAKAVDANLDTLGDIKVTKKDDSLYVTQKGEGGIVRSDAIPVSQIISAKGIKATSMELKQNVAYIGFETPIAGQQYLLKAVVRGFCSLGDEDTYMISADALAKSATKKDLIADLAISFARNCSVVGKNLFKVYVTTVASGSSKTLNTDTYEVTKSSNRATLIGYNPVGLIIEAKFDTESYRRGVYPVDNVDFYIQANKVLSSGLEVDWATVTYNNSADRIATALKNNYTVADLEYFCMGERGDIYRGVNFPNNFDTKYMVDTQTYGWDLIDISYYAVEGGENPQKSQKELIIACPAPSSYSSSCTAYTVVGDINTAAGTTIVTQIFGS